MLSYTVMQFCDRMFLSWHSTVELAAVIPVGVLNWTVMSLPLGVAGYATTFVAQYFGAKQESKIGLVVWQGVLIGIATLPIFVVLALFAKPAFLASGHAQDLASAEAIYFQALVVGSVAAVIDGALNAYYVGRGQTMVVMVVNIICAIVNIGLNWILIFGNLGAPELGIAGAGIATSASTLLKVVIYLVMMLTSVDRVKHGLTTQFRFDWSATSRLLRFGGPNGLQMMLEGLGIGVFTMVMANISTEASAATGLAFSVNMVAFIPIFGLGMGISTIVGQQIGAGKPHLSERATYRGLQLGMMYTIVFVFIYLFFPELCIKAFESDSEAHARVESLSILMLKYVAAYCFFDTIQIVFVSAIKGAGDTAFVVVNTIVTSSLFVAMGFWGSQTIEEPMQKVNWWWLALTVWILLLSVTYYIRFAMGKWKSMNVIEG